MKFEYVNMDNREMHQLQRLYIQETNKYLASLKEGLSGSELNQQKERIRELSRQLDLISRNGSDPASTAMRRHYK